MRSFRGARRCGRRSLWERSTWRKALGGEFRGARITSPIRGCVRRMRSAELNFDGRTSALGEALRQVAVAASRAAARGDRADDRWQCERSRGCVNAMDGLPPVYPGRFSAADNDRARPRDHEHGGHADVIRRCASGACRRMWRCRVLRNEEIVGRLFPIGVRAGCLRMRSRAAEEIQSKCRAMRRRWCSVFIFDLKRRA